MSADAAWFESVWGLVHLGVVWGQLLDFKIKKNERVIFKVKLLFTLLIQLLFAYFYQPAPEA